MNIDFRWLAMQVGIPIAGPTILAGIVVGLWSTGDSKFRIDWSIVVDMTPTALTFYDIALIASTFVSLGPRIAQNLLLSMVMAFAAIVVSIYHSFTIIWRHTQEYHVNDGAYAITLLFLVACVTICHIGHQKI